MEISKSQINILLNSLDNKELLGIFEKIVLVKIFKIH